MAPKPTRKSCKGCGEAFLIDDIETCDRCGGLCCEDCLDDDSGELLCPECAEKWQLVRSDCCELCEADAELHGCPECGAMVCDDCSTSDGICEQCLDNLDDLQTG